MKALTTDSRKIFSRSSQESGIALIETLVAIAILGLSAVAFITALSTGSIATSAQDEDTIAQGLAQSQMELIKAAPYDATGGSYSSVNPPTGYLVTIGTNSSVYSDNNIQKITINISHNGSVVLILEGYKVSRQ